MLAIVPDEDVVDRSASVVFPESLVFTEQGQVRLRWVTVELRNLRWLALKWSHFRRQEREERVRRALAALEGATVQHPLDAETVKWLAEDEDLGDM
jgi:hypothetical protein